MSYTRAQRGVSFWFVSKKKQPVSLVGLESERSELLEKSFGLGDLRSGSVTAVVQRCGKPTGDCAWPNDPGHHPQFQTPPDSRQDDHGKLSFISCARVDFGCS